MKRYDAVIAGGGLIGASIAFELAQAGMHVALFDAQQPGREASWASAGIISAAPENPSTIPLLPLSRASAALYPAFVKTLQELTGREVGYRPYGTLEALLTGDVREELSTLIAVHHGLGLKAEALSAAEARKLEPGLSEHTEAAILRPDEASVDNRALTQAALDAAKQQGAEIFAGNAAKALWHDGSRCKGLTLANENVEALWTIIAAGCFSAAIAGCERYAPVFPAKGQMVSLRTDTVTIKRTLWSENIYLVPRNDGRILAGATIEHVGFDRHVTPGGMKRLFTAAIELAPALESAQIEETWAGLRPDSPDHLPILGPTDIAGLLFATGHFRSGVLLAPLTAKLIREWATTQTVSVDWERFSPLRFLEAPKAHSASSHQHDYHN
jgi:glycine oxidase